MTDPSFRERLARESEAWVAEGLVSAEQAEALRLRYAQAGARAPEEPRSRAVTALAMIGAIAVGLGVIGFFAANWEKLGHGLRLALLTGAIAAFYAGGFHLRERTGRLPKVGEALYLLGTILFGASLFLVGQMYNVEAHDPLALLIWAVGAVATALVVRSRTVACAALLILTGWVGFEFGTAIDDSGDNWAAFPVVAVFYGCALYGLATAARERLPRQWFAVSGFVPAARQLGLLLALSGLFVFTFSEAADELGEAGDSVSAGLQAGLALFAGLALASAAALALTRRRSGLYEGAALAVAVGSLLFAVLAGGSGAAYALLFNLLVAVFVLGAIYAGYVTDEPWLVNLGVAFVAIDLIGRYFDVFWSALPRSAGLIGAGILILAIAFLLERQRKQLLAGMGG
ncbi:MAG: DUF2157 domain-containing protein [Gaiellaceae bacterium]